MAETWLKCSACRNDIPFASKYYQCSVSTCNRARMRLMFCSIVYWDSHMATLRHHDAWTEDKISPTQASWERELASDPEPARPPAAPARPAAPQATASPIAPPAAARTVASGAGASPVAPPAAARTVVPGGATAAAPTPPRRIVGEPAPAAPADGTGAVHLNDIVDNDVLIVVSKLKKYIKERSGMNCSDAVAEVLSDHVRALCDDSIRAAGRDERKTVLDRDVPRPRR